MGRKSVRFLGGLRPWIGALFALALYLALKSSVLELLQGTSRTIYFYATIAFLAGFSERWAKVLLDSTTGSTEPTPSSVATDRQHGSASTRERRQALSDVELRSREPAQPTPG